MIGADNHSADNHSKYLILWRPKGEINYKTTNLEREFNFPIIFTYVFHTWCYSISIPTVRWVTLIYVNLQEFKHICEQYSICEYESDLPSYEHYLISNEKKAWKKLRPACTGFEPMTSAIPVQCSTNWANWELVTVLVQNKPVKWWINDWIFHVDKWGIRSEPPNLVPVTTGSTSSKWYITIWASLPINSNLHLVAPKLLSLSGLGFFVLFF